MERVRERFLERKIFGGTNFIVVLWTVISMLRLVSQFSEDAVETLRRPEFFIFVLPLIFLTVLNIIMGIALFLPQDKNKMWIISIIIVSATLVVLNSLQIRIDTLNSPQLVRTGIEEF